MSVAEPSRLILHLILAIGLLSSGFGSILVKLSGEAPSLVIAFYRMFSASVFLLPFFILRNPTKRKSHPTWLFVSGIALALHFAFWVSSLHHTSVAVSTLLVNTSPVLVSLFSYFAFCERLTFAGISGIFLAFLGGGLLFWHDLLSLGDWRGATLALAGAAMLGLYLIAGRILRQEMSLIEYVFPTYVLATTTLAGVVWTQDLSLFGFSTKTYLFLLLLGLVPQCVGHTSQNWALKYLSATFISTLVLSEPIIATVLAFWILSETIGKLTLFGGITVGAGIFLVARWGITSGQQIEVVAAVLCNESKIWIQQRRDTDHLEGYWEFPGGKIESGELIFEALSRELDEELHAKLQLKPQDPFLTQEYTYPDRRVRIHFFLVELEFEQSLGNGAWVGINQLHKYRFPPANNLVLEKIRSLDRDSPRQAEAISAQ